MPEVFQVKEYPLVDDAFTGDIYILYGDFTKEGNGNLLKNVGTLSPYDGKGTLYIPRPLITERCAHCQGSYAWIPATEPPSYFPETCTVDRVSLIN